MASDLIEEPITVIPEENEPQEEIEEISLDYEKLYKEELEKNKVLESNIETLTEQIDKYKEIFDKIKEMVE